jgi:hypothetical protein
VTFVAIVRLLSTLLNVPLFSVAGWAYPDSLKMTCSNAQGYIARNETPILATGDEYASFASTNCIGGIPAYVRTRDVNYCFVGLYCDAITLVPNAGYYQGTGRN